MLIAGSFGGLIVFICGAKQEISQVISRPHAGAGSVEVEAAVGLIRIDRVLLHYGEAATKSQRVTALIPGERVCQSVSVVRFPTDVRIKTNGEAAVEVQVGRA